MGSALSKKKNYTNRDLRKSTGEIDRVLAGIHRYRNCSSSAQAYSGREPCTVTRRELFSFNITLALTVLSSVFSLCTRKLSYVYVYVYRGCIFRLDRDVL